MSSKWSEYWAQRISFGVTPFRRIWLEEYLPLCKALHRKFELRKVLDVGCGTGVSGAAFTFYGTQAVLCDVDSLALKVTKKFFKQNPNVSVVLADGFHLPFRKNSFDLTLSEGLLEHFKFTDDVKLLKQMTHCSKLVMAIVPNPQSFLYHLAKVLTKTLKRKWAFGVEMERDVTELELLEMMDNVEFRVVALDSLGHTGHIATFFIVLLPSTVAGKPGRFAEESAFMRCLMRILTKVVARVLFMPDEIYVIGASKV